MDLIALALNSEPDRQSTDEQCIQRVRLRSVKSYIEANLGDPNLSLTMIARKNGISLRYLHHLFRLVDMSDSEWLRAPAIAKMPRPFDRAAARAPIDHGNRLFYGVQQFFPFQQSFSRPLRHTAFGCKGSGWRTEGTVKLEAIPTTVGRVNPKVCSGSRKSPPSWHTTGKLDAPDNITPIFLPSRAPELNPVENVWQHLRQNWLSNTVFENYDAIVDAACAAWRKLIAQPETITSIGMRDWAHLGQTL